MHVIYFASLLDESCNAFSYILIEEGKKYIISSLLISKSYFIVIINKSFDPLIF